MSLDRKLSRGVVMLGALGAVFLIAAVGCKKEEEPTAPGYYEGKMVPKGKATPTVPGKGAQPGQGATKGGSSSLD